MSAWWMPSCMSGPPGLRARCARQADGGSLPGSEKHASASTTVPELARRAPSRAARRRAAGRRGRPSAPRRPPRTRRGSARRPRRVSAIGFSTNTCRPRGGARDRVLGVDVVGRGDEHAVGVLDRVTSSRPARWAAAASRGAHMPAPISAALTRAAPAASRRPAGAPCTGTFAHTWLPSSNSTNSPRGAASAARLVSSHGIRRSSLPVTNRAGLSSCSTHAVEVQRQRPRGGRPPRRRRATCGRRSRASAAAGGPRSRRS